MKLFRVIYPNLGNKGECKALLWKQKNGIFDVKAHDTLM